LANTFAITIAPIAEHTQPIKLILQKLAKAEGIKKTPAPIIFPTTSEVLVHMPIFLCSLCILQDKEILFKFNL
jgi:hypothetical protein